MDDQYRAGPGAPGEGATGQVTASQEADTAYGRQLLQATRPFASELPPPFVGYKVDLWGQTREQWQAQRQRLPLKLGAA